jgi:hypothetical protein
VASLALSVLMLCVVVGVLAGWAFREDRRRASTDEE